MNQIKLQDVVEILPGCPWSSLVYSNGIVRTVSNSKIAFVEFNGNKRYTDPSNMETFVGNLWAVPFKFIKVIDSPQDDYVGQLEEEILGLEADLVVARSCISISEELREQQHALIQKLVEDIDMLKAEVYHLRNLNG